MQSFFVLFGVSSTALLGSFYPFILPWVAFATLLTMVYLWWQQRGKGFQPQSETYKELEKIKKKRHKEDNKKHKHINEQIAYIDEVWGYTKEQNKSIEKFIKERAYSEMYNKLTASLFPQIITLIDNCNARGQKGCKREVSKRLSELTDLMKEELQKKKSRSSESFEITLEVYDQLLSGMK
ncbi:hypothetical protein ACLHDG_01000 [Sulfurovum sp. CS9]|uniref:hypothetical protein n=1 Tax=Sulfurovum sp. CS9 TaxID=3391146 RepID=UPI0039E73569